MGIRTWIHLIGLACILTCMHAYIQTQRQTHKLAFADIHQKGGAMGKKHKDSESARKRRERRVDRAEKYEKGRADQFFDSSMIWASFVLIQGANESVLIFCLVATQFNHIVEKLKQNSGLKLKWRPWRHLVMSLLAQSCALAIYWKTFSTLQTLFSFYCNVGFSVDKDTAPKPWACHGNWTGARPTVGHGEAVPCLNCTFTTICLSELGIM